MWCQQFSAKLKCIIFCVSPLSLVKCKTMHGQNQGELIHYNFALCIFCYFTTQNVLFTVHGKWHIFFQADDLANTPSNNLEDEINRIATSTLNVTDDDDFGNNGDNIEDVLEITENLLDTIIARNVTHTIQAVDVRNMK